MAGCADDSDDVGQGTLTMEIWGEEYIESGVPASDFDDGWAVTFDRFLVSLGSLEAAQADQPPALTAPSFRLWDLTATDGPLALVSALAPAGSYPHARYAIAPATADIEPGNATAADVELMADRSSSVHVEGTATDGTATVSFAWSFSTSTSYDCHTATALAHGAEATVQITIHGDHLFYDSAVSADPALRFSDIALADENGDGEVTQAELEAYDITALPNYDVGNLDIDTLWGFVEHMTTTLGHVDGERHCDATEQPSG